MVNTAGINTTTIAVYVKRVGNDGDWEYAQGFWMTVCSASISLICAILLLINSSIQPDQTLESLRTIYASPSQRGFTIDIMMFIIWLAVYWFHREHAYDI
jgi:hypothetical protein